MPSRIFIRLDIHPIHSMIHIGIKTIVVGHIDIFDFLISIILLDGNGNDEFYHGYHRRSIF